MHLLSAVGCCHFSDLNGTNFTDGDTVWTLLTGDVDMHSVDHLSHLLDVAASSLPCRLVIDLSGVTFLGACGVRTLTDHVIRCAISGSQLRLAHPRPSVRNVLAVTGML